MKRNTKTNSQKFGDGIRKFADKVKGTRKKVAGWDEPDTVHIKQVIKNGTDENGKKVTEINWNDFATWLKEIAQFGLKGGGIATLWLAEYLSRGLNAIFVDNVVIRGMENATKNSVLTKFGKKYPWIKNYLLYYMMVGTMVTAGTQLAVNGFNKEDNKEDEKNKKEYKALQRFQVWVRDIFNSINYEDEIIDVEPGTYGEFKARMQQVLPMIEAVLIAMEGAVTDNNGMHIVYDDATMKPLKRGATPRGKATQGYGNTVGKDGRALNSYSPPITSEEAFEWTRWHLEDKETFLFMFGYDVATKAQLNNMQQAISISSMVYNGGTLVIEKDGAVMRERWDKIRKLHNEYGDALTEEQVKAVFEKYPVESKGHVGQYWLDDGGIAEMANGIGWYINVKKDGDGIRWRRWLEACVMNGDISAHELLDVPVNYMSEFFDLVGRDRKNWFIVTNEGTKNEQRKVNRETVKKFKQWIKNPVDKTGKVSLSNKKKVRDVMPAEMVAQCEKNVNLKKSIKSYTKTERQKSIERETYVIGYEEQYAMALDAYQKQEFEMAATQFENLIAEYPDNALLRNDLAATYNKLGRYDDAIAQAREVVQRIGDKSQYGAAQYNAGFAYEMQGDYDRALANYKLAVANGNKRVQADVTRVIEKKQGKQKGKKTAYNDAAGRVLHKSKTADFVRIQQSMKENNNLS